MAVFREFNINTFAVTVPAGTNVDALLVNQPLLVEFDPFSQQEYYTNHYTVLNLASSNPAFTASSILRNVNIYGGQE